MAGISLSSLNSYGTSTSTSTINFGIDLGEYAAIQNGTYYMLAKKTYGTQSESADSTSQDSKLDLSSMQSAGDALKSAADTLLDKDLWQKKTVKTTDEETGETIEKEDYDRTAINKAISDFVSAYNDMIDSAGNAETKSVLRTATRMIGDTASVANLLDEIGITIGSDNKLTIDEEKLKDASIGTMKTLFEGYGSFADHISSKASSISRSAKEATDTYTESGSYTSKTSGVSSNTTTSSKATYQLTDEMQKAILEQVKLDFYLYGGDTKYTTDSATYTRKMESFLKTVDSDSLSDAKNSISIFRDELSSLIVKAIKAQDSSFKLGNSVDNTILNSVFKNDDELLEKAAANTYGNSFNYSV